MRGTGLILLALGAGALCVSAAFAQSKPQFKIIDATRWDFSVGYNNTRANAPPSQCQCFNMNGGFVFGSVHLTDWFGIEGQFRAGSGANTSRWAKGPPLPILTPGPKGCH